MCKSVSIESMAAAVVSVERLKNDYQNKLSQTKVNMSKVLNVSSALTNGPVNKSICVDISENSFMQLKSSSLISLSSCGNISITKGTTYKDLLTHVLSVFEEDEYYEILEKCIV